MSLSGELCHRGTDPQTMEDYLGHRSQAHGSLHPSCRKSLRGASGDSPKPREDGVFTLKLDEGVSLAMLVSFALDMLPAVSTDDIGVWPADDGELVVSVRWRTSGIELKAGRDGDSVDQRSSTIGGAFIGIGRLSGAAVVVASGNRQGHLTR